MHGAVRPAPRAPDPAAGPRRTPRPTDTPGCACNRLHACNANLRAPGEPGAPLGTRRPYLSSETLMTPSSLGTITAMFTTSWEPSTRCSRTGFQICGLGWNSAAIGEGASEAFFKKSLSWDQR